MNEWMSLNICSGSVQPTRFDLARLHKERTSWAEPSGSLDNNNNNHHGDDDDERWLKESETREGKYSRNEPKWSKKWALLWLSLLFPPKSQVKRPISILQASLLLSISLLSQSSKQIDCWACCFMHRKENRDCALVNKSVGWRAVSRIMKVGNCLNR